MLTFLHFLILTMNNLKFLFFPHHSPNQQNEIPKEQENPTSKLGLFQDPSTKNVLEKSTSKQMEIPICKIPVQD
uniref:Putative ovule protein n=1 Tax=Solanum chacoense TaxID=4108 RepID=A0A0V0H266_SOLCH